MGHIWVIYVIYGSYMGHICLIYVSYMCDICVIYVGIAAPGDSGPHTKVYKKIENFENPRWRSPPSLISKNVNNFRMVSAILTNF